MTPVIVARRYIYEESFNRSKMISAEQADRESELTASHSRYLTDRVGCGDIQSLLICACHTVDRASSK